MIRTRLPVILCMLGAVAASADAFETAATMHETRQYPGLALLPDGRVLAVTGHPLNGRSLASAEIYDPVADSWRPSAPLNVARNGVQPGGLVALPNGNVLIAGGGYNVGSTPGVELFNPEEETWKEAAPMSAPRANHTSTLLNDGRVLVTGGIDWGTNEVTPTTEVYDPANDSWIGAGAMQSPRMNHAAVRLGDGRVLVMGGATADPFIGNVTNTCDIFDPKTAAWIGAKPMIDPRRAFRAVLLNDGDVLVVGGSTGSASRNREMAACERFDPNTGTWRSTSPLRQARWGPTATRLSDGRVLVTGGMRGPFFRLNSTEIYEPATGAWSDGPPLKQARNGHRAIVLADGTLLIVGGYSGTRYLASCEIYAP